MYLDQLISRSLILVTVRGSLGGVKLTQIHDLLRGFAVLEAAKEGFLLTIDRYSDFPSLSSLGYPWSRLCIYPSMREEFFCSNPLGHRVRSLVFPYDPQRLVIPSLEVFHSTIDLSTFLVLRVFELPDINIKQVRPSLLQLIHLRFLAFRTCERDIFSDILHRLRSLETLIIMFGIEGGLKLSLSDIDNIARLRFLRYFEVCGFTFPRISQDGLEKMNEVPFDNLQYLSSPILCSGKNQHKKFMQQMSNLRKLKCHTQNQFPNLNFLSNLESLSISGLLDRKYHTTTILHFPPYLKKLTLRFLRLPWTTVSIVGKLKHLQVLKFQFIMFSTDVWDMVECNQQIPKLQYLQLHGAEIKVWNASVENLPLLERLNVTWCWGLEELPSCLADILTLQEVILSGYCNSLAISADEIKEQQVEQGNEQLRVQKIPMDPYDLEDSSKEHTKFHLTMINMVKNFAKSVHELERIAEEKLL